MPITAPTPALPMPDPPDTADIVNFDPRADEFNAHLKEHTVPELNALGINVYENALAAFTASTIAVDKAELAIDAQEAAQISASAAATQAAFVLVMAKLNLGAKAADPALDNQGGALMAGASYYNTTLEKVRIFSGAAWVDGISAIAGVTSVNGQAGAVANIATTGANTYTGDQSLGGKKINDPLLKGTLELRATAAIAASVLALDLSNGITGVTLNANITSITFANNAASATACQVHALELTGDGTQRTIIWPAGDGVTTLLVRMPSAGAPIPTKTLGQSVTYYFKSKSKFVWDLIVGGEN